jgi:hypothetical protein
MAFLPGCNGNRAALGRLANHVAVRCILKVVVLPFQPRGDCERLWNRRFPRRGQLHAHRMCNRSVQGPRHVRALPAPGAATLILSSDVTDQ